MSEEKPGLLKRIFSFGFRKKEPVEETGAAEEAARREAENQAEKKKAEEAARLKAEQSERKASEKAKEAEDKAAAKAAEQAEKAAKAKGEKEAKAAAALAAKEKKSQQEAEAKAAAKVAKEAEAAKAAMAAQAAAEKKAAEKAEKQALRDAEAKAAKVDSPKNEDDAADAYGEEDESHEIGDAGDDEEFAEGYVPPPPEELEIEESVVTLTTRKAKKAAEPEVQVEEERKAGWLTRLTKGLSRSSNQLKENISQVFTNKKLDDNTIQDLEDVLIQADLGVETAMRITDALSAQKFGKEVTERDVREVMAAEIEKILEPVAQDLDLDLGGGRQRFRQDNDHRQTGLKIIRCGFFHYAGRRRHVPRGSNRAIENLGGKNPVAGAVQAIGIGCSRTGL
jgi:fused signal recognition particle receptor